MPLAGWLSYMRARWLVLCLYSNGDLVGAGNGD